LCIENFFLRISHSILFIITFLLPQKTKADLSDLERQLASARKQLEEETLAKVDLENRVQSLKVGITVQCLIPSDITFDLMSGS